MTTKLNFPGYLLLLFIGASSEIYAENPEKPFASPGMIFELLALNHDIPTVQCPKYRSPTALVPSQDGRFLYVAEQTAKRIAVVDIASKTVIKNIQLPNEVTGIACAPSGRLYATCSSDLWPNGMTCEVDGMAGKVLRRLPGGYGARSPAISPDGRMLYVCNQYGNDVYFIDIARGTLIKKLSAGRQPFSCALTPDGSVLVVANCLPAQKSTDTAICSKVLLVNTLAQRIDGEVALPVGSHSVFDVAVSPDGLYAYVTHLVGMFTVPLEIIEGGWVHTNNFAIIDIKKKRLLNDFPLDDAKLGAANPWSVACTKDMSILCVVSAGSNELTVIDLQKLMEKANAKSDIISTEKGIRFVGCSHDFSALTAIKDRIPIQGKFPRSLAIIGKRAYSAGYFGDSAGNDRIEMFDLALGRAATRPVGLISLGIAHRMNSARKGEQAFSDGTLCYEKWQSCFSCHPLTRTDGLNWILTHDINAEPRNAKSMLYSWWTPPTQWMGKRAHASVSIRLGFKNSLFSRSNEALASCIDTFLMLLKPVPSPYLIKGILSPSAEKGWKIFHNDSLCDCFGCHVGPVYTDKSFHSSGVSYRWDISPTWDTPSIVEMWRDGPYGHIGSFDKIEDMIRCEGHSTCIKDGLSEEDFRNVVQFVLSL